MGTALSLAKETDYRGYRITVYADGRSWRFAAKPKTPDLPILILNEFTAPGVTEDQALQDAKQRIDRLLS